MRKVGQGVLQKCVIRLEVVEQRLLLVQLGRKAIDQRPRGAARCTGAAKFLGRSPQPGRGGDQRIVVEEQTVARAQHVALQRGLVEDQLIKRAQPLLVQGGVRRRAAQQKIGQHQQQAENNQRYSAGRIAHGCASA
jgi:hypothetical protein